MLNNTNTASFKGFAKTTICAVMLKFLTFLAYYLYISFLICTFVA